MRALPKDPQRPARMGELQTAWFDSVFDMARAFDEYDGDDKIAVDPRKASVTLLSFMRARPGLDERQALRAVQALVDRGILKRTSVGWSLSDSTYENLLQQRVRELTGPQS